MQIQNFLDNPSEPLFAAHLPLHRGGFGAVHDFDFFDSLTDRYTKVYRSVFSI